MSEEEKKTLFEYIIRNQHALTYDLEKSLETWKPNDIHLRGKSIKYWVCEFPELLAKIDSSNLMILASASGEDKQNVIMTELKSRSENGESIFYGGRVENQLFARYELNLTTAHRLMKTYPEIFQRILKQETEAIKENPRLCAIAKQSCNSTSVKNLMTIDGLYECLKREIITDQALDFLETLVSQNPNIINYMDMRMLQPDILKGNRQFLERVARYKDQSTELMIIYQSNPDLFQALASKIDEWESTLPPREAVNLEKSILRYASIYAPSMTDAKEDEVNGVIGFCLRKSTSDVSETTEYQRNIGEVYQDNFERRINAKRHNGKPDKSSVPDAYCMKFLGASVNKVKKMFQRKFGNIDLNQVTDPKLKDYIEKMRQMISFDFNNPEDLEKIISLYHSEGIMYSPRDVIAFEEQVNSMILETYEQGFSDTKKRLEELSQEPSAVEILEFQGQPIRKIHLPDKFSILIRSTDTGFKEEKNLKNNSVKEYEEHNPDPSANLTATTYVTEDFLGVAPLGENGVYFIFLDNDRNNIGEIGNGDIDSNIINYGVSSNRAISLPAEKLTDHSRQVYAEATLLGCRRPDAIGLFDDATPRQQELAMQAAAEYGIDIVYADKQKIVDEQIARLGEIEKKFQETGDLKYLATLLSKYETNIAGWLLNRDDTVEDESVFVGINNRRFLSKFNEQELSIYRLILDYCRQNGLKDNGRDSIMSVVDILRTEQAKYDDLDKRKIFPHIKMKFRAQELIELLNREYQLGLHLDSEEELVTDSCFTQNLMQLIAEGALVGDMEAADILKTGHMAVKGDGENEPNRR